MGEEIWKKVSGWSYYEVSNMGRVRSLDRVLIRKTGTFDNRKGRMLVLSLNKTGYLLVTFSEAHKRITSTVHTLVAHAFCGEPNECVHHINGVRHDNREENLEWTTNRGNSIERWKAQGHLKTGAVLSKGKVIRPWRSSTWVKVKLYYLGYYDTEDEACAAYMGAHRIIKAMHIIE